MKKFIFSVIRATFLFALMLFTTAHLWSQCVSGDCRDGEGMVKFKSGASFTGQFSNGEMVSGTYVYANGDQYTGTFKDGKREGKGTYSYASGNIFEGQFSAGEKIQGAFQYINGNTYSGSFKNGKRWGRGIMRTPSGEVYDGYWENGQYLGKDAGDPSVTYVVIAAIANYKNMEAKTGDLRFTVNDAKALYKFMMTGNMGGIEAANIEMLLDEQASRQGILNALDKQFSKADKNDRVIFYFSGHGDKNMFIPYDIGPNYAQTLYHNDIKTIFKKSEAINKILIADACFSGSVQKTKNATPVNETSAAVKADYEEAQVAILLSCTGDEVSAEYPTLSQGVFSFFLIEGLKGEADANLDEMVTIEELYYFVRNNTYTFVKQRTGKSQRPILFGRFDRNMVISTVD
ncbi:MAG: caspase family protein [Saprospiraceae bacterium]|nr:caspase family protein [Saprospiraceae bacterium]